MSSICFLYIQYCVKKPPQKEILSKTLPFLWSFKWVEQSTFKILIEWDNSVLNTFEMLKSQKCLRRGCRASKICGFLLPLINIFRWWCPSYVTLIFRCEAKWCDKSWLIFISNLKSYEKLKQIYRHNYHYLRFLLQLRKILNSKLTFIIFVRRIIFCAL